MASKTCPFKRTHWPPAPRGSQYRFTAATDGDAQDEPRNPVVPKRRTAEPLSGHLWRAGETVDRSPDGVDGGCGAECCDGQFGLAAGHGDDATHGEWSASSAGTDDA